MDKLIRGNLKDYPVRFFAADSTQTVSEMQKIHNTTPTATAATGRTLTAAALMGSAMKNQQDLITCIIKGGGEIRKITATADNNGNAKCDILNPQIPIYINDIGKLDVRKAVGPGTLTVIMDTGLKQPYVGEVELVSSEIAEDFTYYFAKSEQVPSAVALGVLVGHEGKVEKSGGYILQIMPDCPEEMIGFIEDKMQTAQPVTSLLSQNMTPEDIIRNIFEDYAIEIQEEKELRYTCNCSMEKIKKVILSLGREEIETIIREDDGITLTCHFCNNKYHLNAAELQQLMESGIHD